MVDPIDYEGEVTARKKDLEKEKYLPLLLFPQQDVTVSCRDNGELDYLASCFHRSPRKGGTIVPTLVPFQKMPINLP